MYIYIFSITKETIEFFNLKKYIINETWNYKFFLLIYEKRMKN